MAKRYTKMPEVNGWYWDEEERKYTCYHSSFEPGCPGCLEGHLYRTRMVLNALTKVLADEEKWTAHYLGLCDKLQSDLDKARERIKKLEDAFLPLAITHPHLVPEEFKVVSIQREKVREIFGEVEDGKEEPEQ